MKQQNSSEKRIIHKSFKFALSPTYEQIAQLNKFIGCSRYVYNWGLVRWEELYKAKEKPNFFQLSKELTRLKNSEGMDWLNDAPADCLHQSILDLSVAFSNFFKRKNKYPKFHKKGQKDTIRFPHYFSIDQDGSTIKVQKLGVIKYHNSRTIEGTPRSITISKRAGKWYASILCEVDYERAMPIPDRIVGVDVGVAKLATTYDGREVRIFEHNPNLSKEYVKLAILQKRLSHKQKGSRNRNKARAKVARQHARISDMRRDTLHKLSTYLCKNHAAVVHEDLNVKGMMKSAKGTVEAPGRNVAQKRGLNRSISRQGWGMLSNMIMYKAVWYNCYNVVVNPAYTSQMCGCCGFVSSDNRRSQAKFSCVNCGHEINADINAAMNIRRLGL